MTVSIAARAQGNGNAHDDLNSEATARVRDLFRKGVAAFKTKNYEQARSWLLQAWAIRQTPDVAAVLGQTEIHLNRYRDGAEHLDFCLRNVAAAESDEFIGKVRTGFEQAKAQVGLLHIEVNCEGAEVTLDGRAVGLAPIKQTLYVEPGEHVVEASLNGAKGLDPVNAEAGKEFTAEITLSSPTPVKSAVPTVTPNSDTLATRNAPASNPTPSPIMPVEETHRSLVPVIVGGAVFAVGGWDGHRVSIGVEFKVR